QHPIETTIDRFDSDEFLLNFENGTLDVRNGDFATHRVDDYMTKMMPFPYDKEAPCPSWERFIAKVSGGNPEMERYLQRIAGYALTGSIGAQVFFFLYGPPSTGKSTYLNTLLRLMGCYGSFTDVQTFTGGKDSEKE